MYIDNTELANYLPRTRGDEPEHREAHAQEAVSAPHPRG